MAHLLLLESEMLRASIDAERGASPMGLRVRLGGRDVPLMPEPGVNGCDLAASSFAMVPYSNRIANGRFAFEGRSYQLRNSENHAIHGDVRKRPWEVLSADSSVVRCRFCSIDHADVNWPWPFEVDLSYAVERATFATRLVLTNRGDSPMPAGCGFHPYFLRAPTRPGEPVRVQFSVRGVYPDAGGTCIPSGPAEPVPAERDYSGGRALDPALFHDFCALGYDGGGAIEWPGTGLRLSFRASPELGHLVFYNPPKPWFAMEPVSNANDGVNLLARGDPTSGVRVLAPGESLSVSFDLTVDAA